MSLEEYFSRKTFSLISEVITLRKIESWDGGWSFITQCWIYMLSQFLSVEISRTFWNDRITNSQSYQSCSQTLGCPIGVLSRSGQGLWIG